MVHHRHLTRLDAVWIEPAIFFVTLCAAERRPLFANAPAFEILREQFAAVPALCHWRVGRFVAIPDHVHFFCSSQEAAASTTLSRFVGALKQWSSKRMVRELGCAAPVWQKQFFDHLLRSGESYSNKWLYVLENPVRAGLVERSKDWPYGGEIDVL